MNQSAFSILRETGYLKTDSYVRATVAEVEACFDTLQSRIDKVKLLILNFEALHPGELCSAPRDVLQRLEYYQELALSLLK